MKQNKLVIVGLVVIVVLFVVGLSMGLFHGEEENENGMTMRQAQSQMDGWIASLEGALSSFRRKLDRGRLSPEDDCKINQTTYKLTENASTCDIAIAAKDGATVQKAVLSVKTGKVKLRVSYPDDQECITSSRGAPRASLKKFKQSKAKINMSKIKPGKVKVGGGTSQSALILDVIYTPTGADEQPGRCVVTGDVDLMVLDKGGLLKLVCTGCDNNRSVTVELE